MIQSRAMKFLAGSALLLLTCSCSAPGRISEASGFLFDTHASYKICGTGSRDVLDNLSAVLEDVSEAFDACYDSPAVLLDANEYRSDCLSRTLALTGTYGGKISMTCGTITDLWGISDGDYYVPNDDEITAALSAVTFDGSLREDTRYDFGAAAKGYACDLAFEILAASHTEYAVISFNSSTLLYGEKPDGAFKAGITHPDGGGYLGYIETDAAFISTSGGYERYFEADGQRYSHILDLSTGRPAETDLTSVTVIVPAHVENGGILSDWLSTLIYMEGTGQLDKWLAYEHFHVIAADSSGRIRTDFHGFTPDSTSGYTLESSYES